MKNKPLELYINSNNLISNPDLIKQELINKVNSFIDDINQKIEKFRKEKYDEINIFLKELEIFQINQKKKLMEFKRI